jgi:hypothetical protein
MYDVRWKREDVGLSSLFLIKGTIKPRREYD